MRGGGVDEHTFEKIAEAVHIGWMDEKQRQGFADHAWSGYACEACGCPRACGLPHTKHHADMLPYADLPENVKDYDRATVRAVLSGIESAGLKVVPT
jgi:hypothetical protein